MATQSDNDQREITLTGKTSRFSTGVGARVRPGLDTVYTKAAIDLQTIGADGATAINACLESVRDACGVDALFIAVLDNERQTIQQVYSARGMFSTCNPEVLTGVDLAPYAWLQSRMTHLKVLELDDTASSAAAEAGLFSALNIGSILLIGLSIQGEIRGFVAMASCLPRAGWDANLHLLLKLLGTSFVSGQERLLLQAELNEVREHHSLASFSANDGVWDFDLRTNATYFSPRWKSMLGFDHDEFVNATPDWRKLVHPDDMIQVQSSIREHLAGTSPQFESVHRMRHTNGDWRWVLSRAKALHDDTGRLRRLVGVELDITERKLYEEALFREKESAQITLQSIGDGVITTDGESMVEYINPVAEELTGWKLDDATGRPIDEIFRCFHEETCEPLENAMSVAIRRDRPIKAVRPTLLIQRDGNELYIESTAAPIRDDRGVVSGGVLVFHDVSESRELNRRLSYHASHDILTGLVNRREFEARLDRALKSAKARETSYALLSLDLDQFKIVNDSCGHSAGDALLGQLGALLKSKIRWRDTVARMGGDEFGVLLESCSPEEAMVTADALREAVRDFKFFWDDRPFRLGVSIGVVPITADNQDVETLVSAAESACRAAKEAGRNRIHCFQENDIDLMRRRKEMQWAARINNALDESRFELYRQTIRPLHDNMERGTHFEILLRMRDEAGKIVGPDLFIVAAERYGITPNIDRWVIENTLRWLVSEADERERLSLCSINLSGQSLADDKFLPFVIDQFHRSGIDPGKICFEITETAAIASYSQANRFIHSLKELGCMFALDDFGTGLSSFGYLKHFPVDFLKIDGSFVREMLHDPIDREMVRSINEIGHLTGKRTIAEFAENDEIITMLRGMGVDYAQGYGVSEPQPVMKNNLSESTKRR
ncbi:MAG: EAL domain-containing protein [Gammaproteobacteria bacterium]|nr:EAL domain-containing protein [Gammaproteobacteria bacterium]